ncbi:MAG: hypothetical protein NT077_00065 [Candidatus Taylorbacteria bacterium]|nr:hypothetical protein [Candidatus Taylorbacteria bacterium]
MKTKYLRSPHNSGERSVFHLANRVKGVGDMQMANGMFRYLLGKVLDGTLTRFQLVLETNGMGDEYYDLVVLVSQSGERLSIPLPLLTSSAIARIYKHGCREEPRGDHCRERQDIPEPRRSEWLGYVSGILDKIPDFESVGRNMLVRQG